ncbi:MAG: SDR family NAD(P)-dependent oxidoreductase [Verrucomicrobia bacterium]|nr:SDR family NAD(P)-dependent oxidoreductase [Verrucomicrobiota bacterium]
MNSDSHPVVLVTGASTGLGLALARKLLPTPHRLILTARESSLPRFAAAGISESDRVWLRALDVTSAAERQRVVDEADAKWGGVDVLINNAGIAYRAVVEHITDDGRLDQMNINFRAPMELIQLVLPRMRAKRAGRIINLSSVGGMMAMPTMALYSASKFALEGATESLWYEVRPWNIHVSLVQPGFIHSNSFLNTRYTAASKRAHDDPASPYFHHYDRMARMIARLMNSTRHTHEHVAEVILRTMRQKNPPLRVAGTPDAHLFGLLRRFLPRGLYHRLLYGRLPEVKIWGGACEVPGAAGAKPNSSAKISAD